jgi:hypothetical protein
MNIWSFNSIPKNRPHPRLEGIKGYQSALPVTTMFHSPDAVLSKSMAKTSAHPSHTPHTPHASSRTTDSAFVSRPAAPRSSGRLILGLMVPVAPTPATGPAPAPFRAERTPAAARTSRIGAWPLVLCIRCTYVQLSLATGQVIRWKNKTEKSGRTQAQARTLHQVATRPRPVPTRASPRVTRERRPSPTRSRIHVVRMFPQHDPSSCAPSEPRSGYGPCRGLGKASGLAMRQQKPHMEDGRSLLNWLVAVPKNEENNAYGDMSG